MTMQAMVETLEDVGFDVKKFYDTNLKSYRFTIRKNDCCTSALFEYPADTSREYCDQKQREFIDYIIGKWHDDHVCDTDDNQPKKKVVFVGVPHKYAIGSVLRNTAEELSSRGIPTSKKSIYYAGFDTPHVHVRCVCSGDDETDLQGLRADAVFGNLWDIMIRRMNPGADNWRKLDIGMIDYICMIEREASESVKCYEAAKYISEGLADGLRATHQTIDEMCTYPSDLKPNSLYISTASPYHKSVYTRFMNSVYGRGALVAARGNGKSCPCLKYLEEEIGKMADYEIQLQLYAALMKGENNMPTRNESNIAALAAAFRNIDRAFNRKLPDIKNVIYSGPCTIVLWEDGTKTLVRCKDGEVNDPEKAFAMAIAKKAMGTNKSGSNYYDIFKKWLPKEEEED